MAEVGWASLGIVPTFKGFGTQLEQGTSKAMLAAGVSGGQKFGEGFTRDANGRLRDHRGKFVKGYGEAGSEAGELAGSKFGSAFKTVAKASLVGLGALGFGAAAFIKDSVELEAAYGKTMAQIRVATGVAGDGLDRLDDLAIKLGKDTEFSANEASAAMLELAKNGIAPATIEAGALKSALTLATAGDVDLVTAATSMGNALNAFGLKGSKSASVAAALAGAANASSASVGSLAEGLQQASATAADAGLTVQETTALLAAFSNAGISGSDAGTSLKTMLSRLVPQTEKAKKAMEAYGLEFVKANGEFKSAAEISEELQTAFSDLSDAERSKALNTIFGSDARRAATVLMKEGEEGVRDYIKATSDLEAAEEMASAKMEGTAGAIERLKGAWETTKLEFGKAIAPVAADFLEGLAGNLDDLAPKLADFGEWITDEGVPALKDFAGYVKDDIFPVLEDMGGFAKDAAGHVKDLVGFLNDLPKPAKIAGLVALLGGIGAMKMRGGKGALGTAGSVLGLAKPVPVFVTNPGFGGGGAGDVPGKGGRAGRILRGAGAAGLVVGGSLAATKGIQELQEDVAPDAAKKGIFGAPHFGQGLANGGFLKGLGEAADKIEHARGETLAWREALVEGKNAGEKLVAEVFRLDQNVDKVRGRHEVRLVAPGFDSLLAATTTYSELLRQLDGRVVRTHFQTVFDKNVILPGETGPRRGSPRDGGVNINVERVEAHDYNDFMEQMRRRNIRRALDGRRP